MAKSIKQARGWAGVSKMRRLLRKLPNAVTAGIKDEIEAGLAMIEQEARDRAPKRTGRLAADLAHKTSKDGLVGYVGYSPKHFRKQWESSGWRARFTEFGTQGYDPTTTSIRVKERTETAGERKYTLVEKQVARRGTKNSSTTKLIYQRVPPRPAQPFLFPALESKRELIKANIAAAVKAALDQAGRGGGGE